MQKEIKPFERQMYNIVKETKSEDKYAVKKLYGKLSKVSELNIKIGRMTPGEHYPVQMENGENLIFVFQSRETGLIRKTDSAEIVVDLGKTPLDAERALESYENSLREQFLGIGIPFPERMISVLKSMKPGDIFTVGRGNSYVCVVNNDNGIKLKEVMDPKKDIGALSVVYKAKKEYKLPYKNRVNLQDFWNNSSDTRTDTMELRILADSISQGIMNKCEAGLKRGESRLLDFGIVKLKAKRPVIGKLIEWTDEKGRNIDTASVRYLIGWLHTSPVVTEIKREEEGSNYNDDAVLSLVDEMNKKRDFQNVYQILMAYSKTKNGPVSIKMKSYVKAGKTKFVAKSFVFADGKLFEAEHIDNNWNKDAINLKESDYESFKKFCEQKYDDKYLMLMDKAKEEIVKQYPDVAKDIADSISKRAAERAIERGELNEGIKFEKDTDFLQNAIKEYEQSKVKEKTERKNEEIER